MLLSDQSCAMYGAFYTCQKHAMASSQHHMLILHFEDLFEEFCHRPKYICIHKLDQTHERAMWAISSIAKLEMAF